MAFVVKRLKFYDFLVFVMSSMFVYDVLIPFMALLTYDRKRNLGFLILGIKSEEAIFSRQHQHLRYTVGGHFALNMHPLISLTFARC